MVSTWSRRVCLILILLVGLYFRIGLGLSWDQDQHLHPDERFLTMVTEKLRIPASLLEFFNSEESTMSPYNTGHTFFVYGTLPIFVTKYVAFAIGKDAYWDVHIVGRVMASLFDLITMLAVYCLGRLVFNRSAGLLAAALLALVPQNIQLSHFYGVENFSSCFVTLAFLLATGAVRPSPRSPSNVFTKLSADTRRWVAGAGALVGILAIFLLMFVGGLPWYSVAQLAIIAGSILFALLRHTDAHIVTRCGVLGLLLGMGLACKVSVTFAVPFVALPLLAVLVSSAGSSLLGMLFGARPRGDSGIKRGRGEFWKVFGGGVLCVVTMLITFRAFQPYAFGGTNFFNFSLAQHFLNNMEQIKGFMNGGDFPPSIYWVDRTPFSFHLYNMFWWQMGALWFAAAWGGLLLLGVRNLLKPSMAVIPWWAWTVVWFAYNGIQFVKAGRYLSIIYPFFALAAAYAVITLTGWIRERLAVEGVGALRSRIATSLPCAALLAFSLCYAIAITNIYRRPHTRIEASRWLLNPQNVPCGSAVANEHWDDPLPLRIDGKDGFGSGCLKWVEFHHYHHDDAEKLAHTLEGIKSADFILLSSNRLIGSIPRMPRRFPFTSEYYRMLLSGELGFSLEQIFSSYPSLGPLTLRDDDMEEMLLNYDHPKVLVFKKNSSFNYEYVATKLKSFAARVPVTLLDQQS